MIKLFIVKSLLVEIKKKFSKAEANKIIDFIEKTKESPHKGKTVGNVAGIIIKELKYKKFRFYFLIEGNKLKFISQDELIVIILKFIRMSDKGLQQKIIQEIRGILVKIGPGGFS